MKDFVDITGKNLDGQERLYRFRLMNAYDGVRLFHEYLNQLFKLISKAGELFTEGPDGSTYFDVATGMKMLKEVLPWDRIEELAKSMLVDSEIKVGDKVFVNNHQSGIGDFFQGKPRELYTALFYGLCANFEDEMGPFCEALGINIHQSDSSQ